MSDANEWAAYCPFGSIFPTECHPCHLCPDCDRELRARAEENGW